MKHVAALSLMLVLAAAPAAFAAPMEGMDMKGMDMKPSAQSTQPVAAEIKKIDRQAGKVTLKHGPIENLGMAAMTMSFPVRDRTTLKNFKEGDKVSAMFDTVDSRPWSTCAAPDSGLQHRRQRWC